MPTQAPHQPVDAPPAAAGSLAVLRDHVLQVGQTRSYRANSVIVQEGEPAESLYWIVSGELLAYVDNEDGRLLELSRMGPDDYFGELLFASAVRTASVRTVTSARLCRASRPQLEALIVREPQVGLEIIRMLSHRLAALTRTVRGLGLSDVYGRLKNYLDEQAECQEGGLPVVPVSQQEIADRLGASKSMVNKLLNDLEAGGFIELRRRRIALLRRLPARW